ncbi:MAG TPA: pyruvate formate lyase family protein, partial [Candidatus Acidoferrales bacterium]|nr:pyruvate formate lyase family protein [Candidatus Acidoferrales bacterium]
MNRTIAAQPSPTVTASDTTRAPSHAVPARPDPNFALDARLGRMKLALRDGTYRRYRSAQEVEVLTECDRENLSWPRRAARLTRRMCEAQRVVILPEEQIVFTRTTRTIPRVYSQADWQTVTAGRSLHENGPISNICADWRLLLSQGLLGRRQVALATRDRLYEEHESVEFLDCVMETIDAVLGLAVRYADEATRLNRPELAEILRRVPAHPARTFREALQSIRLCHSVLWLSGHYHCGLARFDQYMWPFLQEDLASGRLTTEIAEQLLAEFFLLLNRDSDLYPGIQQGDNGQSLMLGGVKRDGSDAVNPLTHVVLRVARGVGLIDPKINLRVN